MNKSILKASIVAIMLVLTSVQGEPNEPPLYADPNAAIEARVEDFVSRMTLEEKIDQMQNDAPAIKRLGVPAYNWWNEALHGVVAGTGPATVFPQAIALAATWNTELHYRIAAVISDEARAKHHEAIRKGERGGYNGLTFWSPNINIFRDPRWGRGQETYGEDPYLTGRFGVAFVKGLQGDDPKYFKTISTPKHFAVHSGPEPLRHRFDTPVSEYDLWDTYLPAFEACVREGKAESVMSAYNRYNGQACTASRPLLIDILRRQWGFTGYVVSDCDAVADIYSGHKLAATAEEAAAMSVKAGCELNCGTTYKSLAKAMQMGLITESQVDAAVKLLFKARFRLGMFDPPEMVKYAQIPYSVNDCPSHDQLAREAARQSLVLLKNAANTLPLKKTIKTVAVIGPNADSAEVLLGNYNGTPSHPVTILAGIKHAVAPNTTVIYVKGCPLVADPNCMQYPAAASAISGKTGDDDFTAAVEAARKADAVILVLGITPQLESEERVLREGVIGGDRSTLDLPEVQQRLMEKVYAVGKPTVLVLTGGSCLAINWADKHIPAIVEAWYPGQQGGNAVADVLFGDYNPAGRLPVTFYKSVKDLPPFEDYGMANRTYRYFKGKPLYQFGYGLSYTTFAYKNLAVSFDGNSVKANITVTNTGKRDGDEVVQVYISPLGGHTRLPARALRNFKRIPFRAGQSQVVEFTLSQKQLMFVNEKGKPFMPEKITVSVGNGKDFLKSKLDLSKAAR